MSQLELIATATFGLESVVARELHALGYDQQTVEDGRVAFSADATAICRTNLWLRSADRVLVKVGSFPAHDFGELFDKTRELPWQDWLPENAEFPVRGKSVRSSLHSVPDCQSIVKKAIVEKLKQSYDRNWFDEDGPRYAVEVALLKDVATLTIDTTGDGLHKRGYRKLTGPAPIRETLAAGLLQLSFWNKDRPFIDPFCGTGTIPIEATMIGRNMAPGLDRGFAAESWHCVTPELWSEARDEARDLAIAGLDSRLIANDIDEKVLGMARYHARQARVADDIHFQQKEFADLTTKRQYGCVVCNPPYGERSGDLSKAEEVYRQMPQVFAAFENWSVYVLSSHPKFETFFGRRADRRRKLYNGRIECTYFQFLGPRPPD